jgi:hypothetical protein
MKKKSLDDMADEFMNIICKPARFVMVQARLNVENHERMQKLCDKYNVSQQEFINFAVMLWCEEMEKRSKK